MDPAVLAKLIAADLAVGPVTWAIIFFSTVAAAVGAYFGKYLQTKGQNWATKEDFVLLQQQLMASTRLVEEVKSEFGKADWIEKEWKSLQIRKIEEFMDAIHTSEATVREFNAESIIAKSSSILAEPTKIASIYLPSLQQQAIKYAQFCHMRLLLLSQVYDPVWKATMTPAEVVAKLKLKNDKIVELMHETDGVYDLLRVDAAQLLQDLVSPSRNAK